MSKIDELMSGTKEVLTARRVYGDPYEQDGVTIIPAAAIWGGGGGGEGEATDASTGSGGGFGMIGRPVGAYQIKDGEVSWVPAADTTRVILMAQMTMIAALLVLRSILRFRRSAG